MGKQATKLASGQQLEFRMEERPIGYVRMTHKGRFTKRATMYTEWKKRVQWTARAAGLLLPLEADRLHPVLIDVDVFYQMSWINRTHQLPDAENVRKGIVDALFYTSKTGDFFCAGSHSLPAFDPEPGVWVRIKRL